MHWGRAVSTDLVHWQQLPIAIYNRHRGDYAFSGGAVVDQDNTTGWQTGREKVIVVSWTSTGRGECLAYSNDRGRTFTEYEGNPVVEYDESVESERVIAFYTSRDMKQWQLQSRLKGYFECPELVELPVDGKANNTRWVVFAADARYAIGTFDAGHSFPNTKASISSITETITRRRSSATRRTAGGSRWAGYALRCPTCLLTRRLVFRTI
jgi:fructan beta-fructosidase